MNLKTATDEIPQSERRRMMYFEYGETELQYLRSKDKKLAEVIDQIGLIQREVDTDLFSAVVHHIIG